MSELKSYDLVDIQDYRGEVYLKKDVDAAIAELKEFAEDACIERDDNQTAIDELQAENAALKQKLEDVQASMYCDVVDANMEVRRLRRALYKACANWAHFAVAFFTSYAAKERWHNMEIKCLKKAKEYR
jgi:hypothetical protein